MDFPELQARFRELPPLPPVQQLDTWGKHRRSLRNHVATSETIDDFLRWSTVVATMFLGDCPVVEREWRALEAADRARWTCATLDPGVGGAARLPYAVHTTGNLVHQAYHLYQWEKVTGRRVESLNSIVEFGGGYGAMALVCYQLGFRGKYVIYDLPEFSLLQRYYLDACGIPDVACITDGEMPSPASLYVACYSLAETLEADRRRFVPAYSGAYLIAAADIWDGVDNNEWAATFARKTPGVSWEKVYNDLQPGHWYLIGARHD